MFDLIKIAKKTYRQMLIKGYLNEYKYVISIKKNFDTAAWTCIKKGREYINYIYIGDKAMQMANSLERRDHFIKDLMYHEVGHSLYTDKNLSYIDSALKPHNVPFELFNLFEDCRMENRVSTDLSHNFHWIKNVKPEYFGYAHTHPESLLLSIKSYAGIKEEPTKAYLEQSDNEFVPLITAEFNAKRIYKYYQRIVACKESLDLLPILIDWRNEFTTDEEKALEELINRLKELSKHIAQQILDDGVNLDEESSLKELSDLQLSQELSDDSISKEEFDKDGQVVVQSKEQSNSKDLAKGSKHDDNFECNTQSIEEFSSTNLLSMVEEYADDYERDVVKKITPKFERALEDKHRKIATTRPSKRFHSRNLVLGREKIFKRKDEMSLTRKDVALIYDCSGSMGMIMKELKVIAAVFNKLVQSGKATGHLILSSSTGYQTFKFPVHNEEVIDKMAAAYSSEGINQTMHHTTPLLRNADLVFVVTDGDICDEPVDKQFFLKQGIDPIGLYIGEEAVNLSRWFRRYVCRLTMEALVDELVRKLK